MTYSTRQKYIWTRRARPRLTAREALETVRAGNSPPYGYDLPAYNPEYDSGSRAYLHVRWVEKADELMRLAGFADELHRGIGHTGWFTNEFQDETYRGVVYRLPHGRYAYGYADPNNDGCASLCFDNDAETERDAARLADSFAELMAERERAYQAKWQARRAIDDAREAIVATRAECRELAGELRDMRQHLNDYAADYPKICGELRATIARKRHAVTRLVREIRAAVEQHGAEILGDEYA